MPEPIQFYNRYTKACESEVIYGERWLRWAYENPLGRAATAVLIRRSLFSRWYGWRMSRPESRGRIAPFMEQYHISRGEMAGEPEHFPSFNAFFARRLKQGARPIAPGDDTVVFPADGRHFVIPDLSRNDGIFVKGIRFSLGALLRDEALSGKFAGGSMLISRLCPVDYHRFHFPCTGRAGEARLINGPLYSVSPIALRQRPTLLWENKRSITPLASAGLGGVLLLEVGATCVGSIHQTFQAGGEIIKGAEKGFFTFGGSCCITVFEPGRIRFSDDLLEHSAQRREVYAHMGDGMAKAL